MSVSLNTAAVTQIDRGAISGGIRRTNPTPPASTQATTHAAAGTPSSPSSTPPPPPGPPAPRASGPPPAPGATTSNGPQFGLNPSVEIKPPNHNPSATAAGVDALIQKVRDAAGNNGSSGTSAGVVAGQTPRKSGSIIAADANKGSTGGTSGTGGTTGQVGVQDHVTDTVGQAGNAGSQNPFIAVKSAGAPENTSK